MDSWTDLIGAAFRILRLELPCGNVTDEVFRREVERLLAERG